MTTRKRAEEDGEYARDAVERLMFEALRRFGDVVPATPEDVARLEQRLSDEPESVPESMLTPPDLEKPVTRPLAHLPRPVDASTQRDMARASREGKAISQEIEERMRLDREAAERNGEELD